MTPETPDHRLKRMKMRSMRRGIKEMDILLSGFADTGLSALDRAELDLYEGLLCESDQDLWQWVTGQVPPPEVYAGLIARIAQSVQRLSWGAGPPLAPEAVPVNAPRPSWPPVRHPPPAAH